MKDNEESFNCPGCQATEFDAIVRGGSFVVVCKSCAWSAATSWMAIGPKWNGHIKVFSQGDEKGEPLIEGTGSEIWKDVRRHASDGKTLVINPKTN
jgi:transcription initiation factor TFIIIB Brf1 subunit/transcription initiation factor TFIIB